MQQICVNSNLSTPAANLPLRDELRSDIVVLGAGVAGLTAAHDFSRAGLKVTVIDRATQCGGTHRSCNIGPYTFDSGSIFLDENSPLFEMFEGLKPLCPAVLRKQGRVVPSGSVRHYPFEPREVLTWPVGLRIRTALDLARQRFAIRDPKDAEAFCLSRIGRTAYDVSGLKHYITRFHQEDPAEIDLLFCERRMKFVLGDSRLSVVGRAALRLLVGRPPRPKARKRLLVRPREGFAAIYGEVRNQLESRGVAFLMDSPVERLVPDVAGFRITTPRATVTAGNVVAAMPVDTMHRVIFGEATSLEGIDLLTLFVSVSAIPGFDGNVLFNFHRRGRWKRATIYSRIYGKAEGRDYFAVEITQRKHEVRDPTAAFDAFCRDVSETGVFADDLVLEGFDVIEDAYPLYRKGCGPAVDAAIASLTEFGITPVGRQGRFAYLPVSPQVIMQTRSELETAGLGTSAEAPERPPMDLDT